jgi:bacillithiol system protein YtxJ
MFQWMSGPAAPAKAQLDLKTLPEQPLAIVFKHSSTCPVSWAAERQVRQFVEQHPEVPLYTVVVQQERALSREVAEMTGIRHESPQILVFRQGQVVSDTSHEGVTVDYLTSVIAPR